MRTEIVRREKKKERDDPTPDTLEETLRLARNAQDNGWPPELVNKHIILAAGYSSVKAFEKAVVNRASIGVYKNNPNTEKGVIQGYMREVANGLTMGLWDKGEALVNSIINRSPYDFERDLIETEREEYQEANPVHSTVGNIGGAMLTGTGLTKLGLAKLPSLAPKTGAPIANYAREATLEGGIGALEGGLTALNEGGDVYKAMGFGTGIGIGAPAVSRIAGPVMGLVKQGAKRVGELFDPTVGSNVFVKKPPGLVPGEPTLPEKRALDKVEGALTDDAVSPADRRARLKEFEDTGLEDAASPSFLGGENLNQLAKDAVVEGGPQKQAVKKALQETMEENRGRVQQFMDDGLGYNKEGSPQVVDELMEQRTRRAKPLYDKAFKTKPIDGGSEEGAAIEEIMSSVEFRKAYKEAQKTNAEAVSPQYMPDLPDLEKGETGIWTIYALDQVKKIIDLRRRLPLSAQNAPNKLMAKNLGEKTEILLDEMDQFSHSYGEARKIWSGSMEETEAYELGMSAYNTSKKSSVIRSEFKNLKTDAEREMYRLGASTEAIGKMDQAAAKTKSHSKVFFTPDNIKKVKAK